MNCFVLFCLKVDCSLCSLLLFCIVHLLCWYMSLDLVFCHGMMLDFSHLIFIIDFVLLAMILGTVGAPTGTWSSRPTCRRGFFTIDLLRYWYYLCMSAACVDPVFSCVCGTTVVS